MTMLRYNNHTDELKSKSFGTLKQQISDYKTILQTMRIANELDIEDFVLLKDAVGDTVLDGKNILSQKGVIEQEIIFNEDIVIKYKRAADSTEFSWMEWYYNFKVRQYRNLIEIDQEIYDEWQRKEDEYDEIEALTHGLFNKSAELHIVAQTAISNIMGIFQNSTYIPNLNASWRNELLNEYNKVINNIVDRLLIVHDGIVEYNWNEIEDWLNKEAEDLSDREYRALIEVVDDMSDENLETLANMAYIPNNETYLDLFDNKISPVFVELSNRYLKIKEIEAALTIYDADSFFVYDKNTVINELSRAHVLQLISNMNTVKVLHEIKGKHVALTSTKEEEIITYTLTLTKSDDHNLLSSAAFGEIHTGFSGGDVSKLTYTIYPWGSSNIAEFNLDQYAQLTIQSIEKTGWDVTVEEVSSYLASKGIDYIEPTGVSSTITGYLKEQLDNYEQTIKINGAISAIDAGNYITALGISTGIVATDGFATNRIAFVNSVIDSRELLVRLAVYNKSHDSITEADVKRWLENNDPKLDEYVDWYYKGRGCDDIEEYWLELGAIAMKYQSENISFKGRDVREFSSTQLQELIKKEADPSYVIDDMIMESK